MNCDRARELSSEALDHTLPRELTATFRAHLEACPPCRAFVAELQESLALLRELPELEVNERFNEAVWARLREERPRPQRRAWWEGWRERFALAGIPGTLGSAWRWAPLGAAAIVLLVFALTSEPGFEQGSPGMTSAPPVGREISGTTPVAVPSPIRTRDDAFAARTAPGERGSSSQIPEAIEAYLRNGARDLRLQSDSERLRGSTYTYPIRRVGDSGLIRVGSGGRAPGVAPARPVSEPGFTVISF